MVLGWFLVGFGVFLGWFLDDFGVVLGCFWGDFGVFYLVQFVDGLLWGSCLRC